MPRTLAVHQTRIPGLLVVDLPVLGDARGWFKENWHREKMIQLGLPDFTPVQNNISFNASAGSTRGMHAEPWDKLVSLASGRIFGAWVDLRQGPGFGSSFALELDTDQAVFVPRGVANGYQALAPDTVYSYLVNEHWTPEARDSYTYLNLADPTIAIPWPISLLQAEVSDADREHPSLCDVTPMAPRSIVVVGANGQLGRALMAMLPDAVGLTRPDFDLSDAETLDTVRWGDVGLIVNAAAYTAVDTAETEEGRRICWATNVSGLRALVERARAHRIPFVHISSDYVFDGTTEVHSEEEPISPLGVYGQTKAAGEALVSTLPQHWIVRTSWLIGDGSNFIRTMARLADTGVSPQVVNDQFGRLTFAEDLASGVMHLATHAPPGTYHLSNAGPVRSWAQIASLVFQFRGRPASDVLPITTAEFTAGSRAAPRPRYSTLSLAKTITSGFSPPCADERLAEYLSTIPLPGRNDAAQSG
ncbi:dTDP-4-dehydrorhamnose 3,5-epimerase [Tessaracoccus bendigoensis DSM 12906]|uniref:dTDP-4-dehydrorhamnose reductase n=1 Tax=Tessaracoccus bendigoensis DSM 12906 TaxID=1123357 RepID=A0A1M6MV83_9ACTN|nr:sugar nucleotide-binding protein [Tessaracoccus bendigoensis]SHJ87418.1 dTDP-4-dehydrorhamnose 3,5-epimerase [Tessaracoccus bendigoensis DSM 12906]